MVSLLLVLTLCSGMVVNGYASEIDDTKKKAEELENKKKTAENEKASLAEQLKQLTQKNLWRRKSRLLMTPEKRKAAEAVSVSSHSRLWKMY